MTHKLWEEGQGQMKGKESEVLPPSGLVRIKKPSFHTKAWNKEGAY